MIYSCRKILHCNEDIIKSVVPKKQCSHCHIHANICENKSDRQCVIKPRRKQFKRENKCFVLNEVVFGVFCGLENLEILCNLLIFHAVGQVRSVI